MTQKKRVVIILVVIIFVYFLVIPIFWDLISPTATAVFPEHWPYNQDLPVQIRTRAIHANYLVTQVRLSVDTSALQLDGTEKPFYPETLMEVTTPRYWTVLTINRFTFPVTRWFEVQVPLARLADEKRSGAGTLTGTLDVEINYVGGLNQYRALMGKYPAQTRTEHIPFVILLE